MEWKRLRKIEQVKEDLFDLIKLTEKVKEDGQEWERLKRLDQLTLYYIFTFKSFPFSN